MFQTVYREIDFDDEITARQQRDAHLAELQAQGMECIAEDLYNVIEGWRVFTLVAAPPARPDVTVVPRLKLSKPSQSGAAEPPTQSDPLRRQDLIPQKPFSKRAKHAYEVR
jgi:hypothetical protein